MFLQLSASTLEIPGLENTDLQFQSLSDKHSLH